MNLFYFFFLIIIFIKNKIEQIKGIIQTNKNAPIVKNNDPKTNSGDMKIITLKIEIKNAKP